MWHLSFVSNRYIHKGHYIRKARKEQFMPRLVKCRKVCHFPNVLEFLPADNTDKKTPIVLTVDEYETIRLLDKKGYSQEQCAASM